MVKIQRLSASSFRITSPQGKVIMLDPWLVGDPVWPNAERDPAKLSGVNTILVTHAHFDHSSGVGELLKINPGALAICQLEIALAFMGQGMKNIYPMNKGGTIVLDGIKYSMVGADHTSSFMSETGYQYAGTSAGFVIEMEDGFKIYASGDTGLTSDMKTVVGEYFRPHLAILPAIGTMMMEPEQAVVAADWIRPKYVIPFHDFPEKISDAANPEGYEALSQKFPIVLPSRAKIRKFVELMKRSRAKVTTLDFGEAKEFK